MGIFTEDDFRNRRIATQNLKDDEIKRKQDEEEMCKMFRDYVITQIRYKFRQGVKICEIPITTNCNFCCYPQSTYYRTKIAQTEFSIGYSGNILEKQRAVPYEIPVSIVKEMVEYIDNYEMDFCGKLEFVQGNKYHTHTIKCTFSEFLEKKE